MNTDQFNQSLVVLDMNFSNEYNIMPDGNEASVLKGQYLIGPGSLVDPLGIQRSPTSLALRHSLAEQLGCINDIFPSIFTQFIHRGDQGVILCTTIANPITTPVTLSKFEFRLPLLLSMLTDLPQNLRPRTPYHRAPLVLFQNPSSNGNFKLSKCRKHNTTA
jgi:hypothetical protein